MNCSLNTFCDFFEATSPARRALIVKQLKLQSVTQPGKGRMGYYKPVFRLIRGTLSPGGTLRSKMSALRTACAIASWSHKLNQVRFEANALIYDAYRALFDGKALDFLSNPRLQFPGTKNLTINLQPDLLVQVDGKLELWKIGTAVKPRKERTIRAVLQMFQTACKKKGLELKPEQIRFFDARTGKVLSQGESDPAISDEIFQASSDLDAMLSKGD